MINSFSLQQILKTSNLESNLISRQYKLNLMADFMRIKFENPKLKQSEIANQLGDSTSTLQRYRYDVNMFSPYRIQPNNSNKRTKKVKYTNFDNNFHHDCDIKRPRMTSNDHKRPQSTSKTENKNSLNGGRNIEIIEHYLDEILHNINT